MGVNRRDFLKITGLGTLAGVGGKAATDLIFKGQVEAQEARPNAGALVGKRWAMVVDTKKCIEKIEKDGCKDCTIACHAEHNVPEFGNPKDEIKWIWQDEFEHVCPNQHHPFVSESLHGKPFLAFCNHCDNPPCVRVCPTKATFQREDGLVLMDFHRCIGCRFCMAGCPYGSRSFNWRDPRPFIQDARQDFPTRMRGVVEKCNFCAERLAVGKIPACVEACKVKALTFGDLEDSHSEVREILHERFSLRRKPELGTKPQIFYLV
jgi:molybdopterin-containing oxidoreductase family iron-sulfur binding subunit